MKRPAVLAFLIVALVPLAAPASPATGPGDTAVRFTFTITDLGVGGEAERREATVLARDEGQVKLLTGWRLPIPTTSHESVEGGTPVTVYSYQDVGVSLTLRARLRGSGRLHARGRLEVSGIDSGVGSRAVAAPRLATFDHQFDVLLDDGVEVELARVPRPAGGSTVLAVRAQKE